MCHLPFRQLLRDVSALTSEQMSYALHPNTHIDFLLYNRVSKQPILGIETDGYYYHMFGTPQSVRDELKNQIFAAYGISLLRLSTTGTCEPERVVAKLREIM